MTDLFNRDIAVTVGTLRIAARVQEAGAMVARPTLRMTFTIEKSLNRDPNKAEVTIYNLNEAHRKGLQKKLPCIIEAGYVGATEKLFSGNVSFASHNRETTAWVSKIQSRDGGSQYSSSRLSKSFGPGTQMSALLNQAAAALGVGPGNAAKSFAGPLRGGLTQFTKGVSVSGRVSDILDKYVTTAGMEWSIQDGQLQVLAAKGTTQQQVINLSADSGLIGSPELGEKGIVKARSLLMGGLLPGRKVKIESALVLGFFRIEKVKHYGDTWGNDWYTDLEAKPL